MILGDLMMRNFAFNKFCDYWKLTEVDRGFGNAEYWFSFTGFMANLPYLAKLTMEAVIYFHAYFAMWDVNLVPA